MLDIVLVLALACMILVAILFIMDTSRSTLDEHEDFTNRW